MNDMIIGMENLPNVFIEKITIERTTPAAFDQEQKVTVRIGMYDHKNKPTWRNRIDGLKIKIVFESDLEEISSLNNGSKSLYDYRVTNGGPNFLISCDTLNSSGLDGDYELYIGNVETILGPGIQNVNVYAASLIGDLVFEIDVFNKFYGPMVGEQILVGGQTNELSNYFYYPDTNEEYGGPVHQKTDGSYMEGSEHSESPHRNVVLVSEDNYKIQAISYGTEVSNEEAVPEDNTDNDTETSADEGY